ncbi:MULTISPECIES: carbohydrate ABC transporter permease [Paenibacillus]|jgi:multiple sugar transport system permease protein|uniref:Lactose/L-arabinose transport system permease n=2 Tax=Paenibacillus barengoltzii TaxID=343517 RepID=R9LAU3_9BACL|nr:MULTISPECIES: carbohydrate ABC transporter permease [Paenibacillus]EOS55501.1 lactose/L-arabinose transport system permease [Paenibacillus barengoltzii G22]MDU0330592.1 carbohydrate ABC transporter permease [Paenibacillus sp. 3LSP]MEC2345526.1 carbohydrate ABC transporter permease [Paenibacillus barengoltzii]SMF24489.1 carbohydrate ABC transporter membrane protein 2, CUT1 family (TC 3.A.1.1.-) [Paenibacillus barengoltzii]SMF24589.1 carbohydrate ABC transporter membrane protein 2, CUT1 famil
MQTRTSGDKALQWLVGILLGVMGLLMLLPFVWMILSSFKPESEVAQIPPTLWPHQFTLENFQELFENMRFGVYLRNTLIIVVFSFLGLFLNALAGFAFAKYKFKGRDGLFYLVLATMMIPGQVTMIPVYLILNMMGLTNTMVGIVLPGLVGAFGIFLFRQFMSTIPDELMEATRLDGAGEFRIFVQIALPISKSILAVQGILTFIAGWNSFLWPLIIANDESLYTLSVGLQLLKGQYGGDYALQMAGSAFMVVPIIIIFIIFQKHIIENYSISGMK